MKFTTKFICVLSLVFASSLTLHPVGCKKQYTEWDTYMNIYILCIYLCRHIYICLPTYMYKYIHTCMYAYAGLPTCLATYIQTYTCIDILHICMHKYIFMYVYVYMYIGRHAQSYVCKHVHKYTYYSHTCMNVYI